MQMILQGFEQKKCQEPTVGASDFHARTSALQENSRDLEDSVLACFLQLRDLLEDKRKKIDPLTYSLKTLKIYLALTEGSILHGSSWSWTKSGMMQSGRFSTLPMSSLKTGKEFSLLDILEDDVPKKYFLSEQTAISYKDNAQSKRVYKITRLCPTLTVCGGGNTQPKAAILFNSDRNGNVRCLDANYFKGLGSKQRTGVYDGQKIRKLTPKECFRLQGFPDNYFDRTNDVCSDSQLYKQAGNSVTVPVVYEIVKRMKIGE